MLNRFEREKLLPSSVDNTIAETAKANNAPPCGRYGAIFLKSVIIIRDSEYLFNLSQVLDHTRGDKKRLLAGGAGVVLRFFRRSRVARAKRIVAKPFNDLL